MKLKNYLRQLMLPILHINIALPSQGLVYEIGCNQGALARAIAEDFPKRHVIGIDLNPTSIVIANQQKLKNTSFIASDAITFNYKSLDGAVLSDFLHHINFSNQEKLLTHVIKKLKSDGVLIIKEIDADDGLLTWCSRLWDWLFYPHDMIYYRSQNDWLKLLNKLKLKVTVTREVPWFPGSTKLYICSKN